MTTYIYIEMFVGGDAPAIRHSGTEQAKWAHRQLQTAAGQRPKQDRGAS